MLHHSVLEGYFHPSLWKTSSSWKNKQRSRNYLYKYPYELFLYSLDPHHIESQEEKRFVCWLSYLNDNSVDVSQQSNSGAHIVPHLLSTKVNLQSERTCSTLLWRKHFQQQRNTMQVIRQRSTNKYLQQFWKKWSESIINPASTVYVPGWSWHWGQTAGADRNAESSSAALQAEAQRRPAEELWEERWTRNFIKTKTVWNGNSMGLFKKSIGCITLHLKKEVCIKCVQSSIGNWGLVGFRHIINANDHVGSNNCTSHLLVREHCYSERETDLERAAATQLGWSSGRTPFPMGVGRNGRPTISTSSRRAASARP